jgi:hypothetical protein
MTSSAKAAASREPTARPKPSRWLLILSSVLFTMWLLFLLAMALTA